ncbi:MAG TPA: NAD(P)/FAD-dependent oxidoreductase [Paracoccaceae bacterium]|nr:NAD(P)/FAD-dependent oxidoreductase [Paracoccaceae bacterium]
MQVDAVILGGGAAGLFCAGEAARRGRRVLVIEHGAKPGEKIRISGGGRCNFTNIHSAPDRFLSRNPRFAASALARFTPQDFVARIEAAGITWHEKTLGQLFCDGPATQVTEMLLDAMQGAGAVLWTATSFGGIVKSGQSFAIETSRGVVSAARVVVATGGKSIPKMGATDAGYRLAQGFGVAVVPTRPALVPLTFAEQELEWCRPLSGTAVQGRANCGRQGFDEAILFTHRGLSGPAILQISSYWREGEALALDLARGQDAAACLRMQRGRSGRMAVATALAGVVPERLARVLVARAGLAGNLADQSNAALDRLAAEVHAMSVKPVGSEGYRTAEVTLGGVDTAALDARTMEARAVPGLHFIGEVVDVTGWLGGYNFQWAWSSAWACAQSL